MLREIAVERSESIDCSRQIAVKRSESIDCYRQIALERSESIDCSRQIAVERSESIDCIPLSGVWGCMGVHGGSHMWGCGAWGTRCLMGQVHGGAGSLGSGA